MKYISLFLVMILWSLSLTAQIWIPLGNGAPYTPTATTQQEKVLVISTTKINNDKSRTHQVQIWTNTGWIQLPALKGDSSSIITDVYYYKNAIYIGGQFDQLNNISSSTNIIRWKNRKFEAVPNFISNVSDLKRITEFSEFKGNLVISGRFKTNSGKGSGIVLYNGSTIEPFPANFGTGVNGIVLNAIQISSDQILIGGIYSTVDAVTRNNFTIYDATKGWRSVVNRLNIIPSKMSYSGTEVFIAGKNAKRQELNIYTLTDGDSIVALDSGIAEITAIYDLVEVNGKMYASGIFKIKNNSNFQYLIQWDGAKWISINQGDFQGINLLASYNNQLICTGLLSKYNVLQFNRVAVYKEDASIVVGRVYFDKDKNCTYDARDEPLAFMSITMDDKKSIIPNKIGNYFTVVEPGLHTFKINPTKLWQVRDCGAEDIEIKVEGGEILLSNDFPMYQKAGIEDVSIYMQSSEGLSLRKNQRAQYKINFENSGSVNVMNTRITLNFDERLTHFKSNPEPDYISTGTMHWDITDFYAGEKGEIEVLFDLSSSDYKQVNLTAFIENGGNESDTSDNSSQISQKLSDDEFTIKKEIYPNNGGDTAFIDTTYNFIDYQITYANFTSDTLKTVVVIDTIQLNHDLSYIQELGKSHNAELQAYSGVPGSNLGVLVWRFNDINLPPKLPESETNDHRGYIAFRIGLSSSLSSGTTISNRAGVIMDYYEQESTNTVYAVVNSLTLSVEDNQKEQYALKVYPNPVRTKLFIHNTQNDEIRSVRVYSSKGQLVLEKNRFFDNSIDLSSLISGVYFISLLNTSNKYSYSKVIKID